MAMLQFSLDNFAPLQKIQDAVSEAPVSMAAELDQMTDSSVSTETQDSLVLESTEELPTPTEETLLVEENHV